MYNHSITPCNIIKCLSTTHYREIKLATKVEDELEEELEEAEVK
jgi:hypothetical protein